MKTFLNFTQKSIFVATILLIIPFGIGLYEKIKRPTFKNMPSGYYVLIGIVLIAMIVSDVYYIKHLQRKKK